MKFGLGQKIENVFIGGTEINLAMKWMKEKRRMHDYKIFAID